MDFGFIYFHNREISRAAMGSGCLFFVLFIILPIISCFLFIPLYLMVFVLCAANKFQLKDTKQILLFPLAPFAVACVLCAVFWWLIPDVINLIGAFLSIFKSIFANNNSLFTPYEDIPDKQCFLYFISVFGCGLGSIVSIFSIEDIMNQESKNINKKEHYDILHDPKYKQRKKPIAEQQDYMSSKQIDEDTAKWLERHRRKTSNRKQ